ncbi:MAG: hypothetical protein GY866_20260 [Proteobacteria bacterium]|nr:hypothetical protein [Pseudomonadota bacterium]
MTPKLTNKQLFLIWIPLALSWLMMSLEWPYVAAIIARLGEAKYNLAAHGVAFSIALIVEAPIINIASAATAICHDRDAYLKLRNFTTVLNVVLTGSLILLLQPFVFDNLVLGLIGIPEKVAEIAHTALVILLPWPAAIGFRRLYQGILIKQKRTRRVTYCTGVRLASMSITALVLYNMDTVGAYTGAAALSAGVVAELIAARLAAISSIGEIKAIKPVDSKKDTAISYRYIIRFYYPLGLVSVFDLGVQPMVTFFMGKSRFPVESLAVLPVINSLLFVFRSVSFSMLEVIITLLGDKRENHRMLRNFAFGLGIFLVALFSLVAFTPLSQIWFHDISGLSRELTRLTTLPVRVLVLLPGVAVLITYQWGVLVHAGQTACLSKATAVEVVAILATMSISIGVFDMIGVQAAAIAFMLGASARAVYLLPHYFKIPKPDKP